MRLHCWFCQKSVSTEVPHETVVRATLICPECIIKGMVVFPDRTHDEVPADPEKDAPSNQHGTFTGWDPKLQRWIGPDACPSCSGYGKVMEAQHGQSVRCERCGGTGYASNTP